MTMVSCLFTLSLTLVLPIAAAVAVAVKMRSAKAVLLGAACFFVFQMLLRIPLLQYVLLMNADYLLFQAANPAAHIFILALSAGVFEECGRYIVMRLFLKNSRFLNGVAFGIGHGGFEAIALVGVNTLALLIMSGSSLAGYAAADIFFAGAERLFAMVAHVGFSVIVWLAAQTGRRFLLFAAILLHSLFNFVAVYLAQAGLSTALVETVIAVCAAALLAGAVLYYKIKVIRKEEL